MKHTALVLLLMLIMICESSNVLQNKCVLLLGNTGSFKSTIANLLFNMDAKLTSMMKPFKTCAQDESGDCTVGVNYEFSKKLQMWVIDPLGIGLNFQEDQVGMKVQELRRLIKLEISLIVVPFVEDRLAELDRIKDAITFLGLDDVKVIGVQMFEGDETDPNYKSIVEKINSIADHVIKKKIVYTQENYPERQDLINEIHEITSNIDKGLISIEEYLSASVEWESLFSLKEKGTNEDPQSIFHLVLSESPDKLGNYYEIISPDNATLRENDLPTMMIETMKKYFKRLHSWKHVISLHYTGSQLQIPFPSDVLIFEKKAAYQRFNIESIRALIESTDNNIKFKDIYMIKDPSGNEIDVETAAHKMPQVLISYFEGIGHHDIVAFLLSSSSCELNKKFSFEINAAYRSFTGENIIALFRNHTTPPSFQDVYTLKDSDGNILEFEETRDEMQEMIIQYFICIERYDMASYFISILNQKLFISSIRKLVMNWLKENWGIDFAPLISSVENLLPSSLHFVVDGFFLLFFTISIFKMIIWPVKEKCCS